MLNTKLYESHALIYPNYVGTIGVSNVSEAIINVGHTRLYDDRTIM